MERFDVREFFQQDVTWRVLAVLLALQAAGRLQFERGRPVGAVGASLDVAATRMLVPALILMVVSAITWLVMRRR